MTKLGGGFQSFSIRIPLIQICTRLDLLTDKRVVHPPAGQKPSRSAKSGLGPKRKNETGVSVELVGEDGGLAVRLRLPAGAQPDVIVWEDRFFLRNGLDGGFKEGQGHHVSPSKANSALEVTVVVRREIVWLPEKDTDPNKRMENFGGENSPAC
jgi:hypothetical protein